MACELQRPDPQDLFNRYRNMFSNTVLGGAAVVEESNEWYATSVNYAIAEEFYAITEQAWKERDPRTACCENLYDLAAMDGVYPRPAVSAQGYVKVTGVAATVLPAPLEFLIGEQTFVSSSAITQPTAIGDTGVTVIRVRALTPGAAGNITETEGTLTSVVDAAVETTVEICGGTFCDGSDSENCEAFRQRYLRRLRYQPRATNAWMVDKLLEWPCATRAFQRAGDCCRCGNDCSNGGDCGDCGCADCGGDLSFYVMMDNTFDCGIAPATVVEEIQDWMFGSPQGYGLGQVEVGVCGRIVPVNAVMVDIFVDIADCPTASQVQKIREQITEYFTTAEPSHPVYMQTINSIVAGVMGIGVNTDARLDIVNEADEASDRTYQGNCDIEFRCDYMPCLRNINFTSANSGFVDCPS